MVSSASGSRNGILHHHVSLWRPSQAACALCGVPSFEETGERRQTDVMGGRYTELHMAEVVTVSNCEGAVCAEWDARDLGLWPVDPAAELYGSED